jgi:hypothetical protein
VHIIDNRGDSLNAIRDRYEQLRAEVQARRRKHVTHGSVAPSWRRPGPRVSRPTLGFAAISGQ